MAKPVGAKLKWATVRVMIIDGPWERVLAAYSRTIATASKKAITQGKNVAGQELGFDSRSAGEMVGFMRVGSKSRNRRLASGVFRTRVRIFGFRDEPVREKDGKPPSRQMVAAKNAIRRKRNLFVLPSGLRQKARERAQQVFNRAIAKGQFKPRVVTIRKVVGYKT